MAGYYTRASLRGHYEVARVITTAAAHALVAGGGGTLLTGSTWPICACTLRRNSCGCEIITNDSGVPPVPRTVTEPYPSIRPRKVSSTPMLSTRDNMTS